MIIDSRNQQQPAVNVFPNGGYGGGGYDGGNGGWIWIIILFFFAILGGWGNNSNNGGGGGGVPYVGGQNYVQQGFDQAALMAGISGVQNSVATGFANAEVSRCNSQANLLQTMNNNQNAAISAMNGLAMSLQNCCCENRAATADLKYTVATEACNDRAAVNDALQAVTAQNTANMNAMMMTFNNGIQSLKDEFCQTRMESKDQRIADLERQLTFSQTAGLVNGTRDAITANNDLQTAALEQYLAPTARPAYIVQNPNCCQNNYSCRQCG